MTPPILPIGTRVIFNNEIYADNGMEGEILDSKVFSCGNLHYFVKWANGAQTWSPASWITKKD